jgi:hypothetical protein
VFKEVAEDFGRQLVRMQDCSRMSSARATDEPDALRKLSPSSVQLIWGIDSSDTMLMATERKQTSSDRTELTYIAS